MKLLLLACGLTSALSISNTSCFQKKNCTVQKSETIFTDIAINNNIDTSFVHYVFFDGFSEKCNEDSIKVISAINEYIDTLSGSIKPVGAIHVYVSKDRFIPRVKTQNWSEVNKDCMISVWFNTKTKNPIKFAFYDNKGRIRIKTKTWPK